MTRHIGVTVNMRADTQTTKDYIAMLSFGFPSLVISLTEVLSTASCLPVNR